MARRLVPAADGERAGSLVAPSCRSALLTGRAVCRQSSDVGSEAAAVIERFAAGHLGLHMRWSQGELGRPGDNLYRLTSIAVRAHKLLIEFDKQVLVVLTEATLRRASDVEVVVSYDQLTIDRQGYGDMTPHCESFAEGEFTIYR